GRGVSNVMHGDAGNDVIVAKGGSSVAYGGSGDDVIKATGGVNVLHGDDGNDTIEASGGVNVVYGNAGDDDMQAIGGVNTMFGGDGDDRMKALGVANVQYGGNGDDLLAAAGVGNLQFGQSGDDKMFGLGSNVGQFGGDGEDVLVGVAGLNLQHGGAGKDKLFAVGGANIQIGGSDDDFLMAGGANNIQFGDHLWSAIPSDLGFDDGRFAEVIEKFDEHFETGDGGTNVMIGGGTNNLQFGGTGKDFAFGAGAATTQVMGQGNDVLIGGGVGVLQYADAGNDVVIGGGQGVLQFGGEGSDIMVAAAKTIAPQFKGAVSFQHGGADTDFMLGLSFGDEAAGSVTLKRKAGSDGNGAVVEGALPDELVVTAQLGGDGADLLFAGGPGTIVHGGDDNDIALSVGDTNTLVMGGEGDDLILSSSGLDKMVDALEMEDEIDNAEDIDLLSFSFGNLFSGGAGSDVVMDISDFAKIMIHDVLTDIPLVQQFRSTLTDTLNAIEEFSSPISGLIETVADFSPDFGVGGFGAYEVKANVTLGGMGDDVLGGEGFLSGEAGDDTYAIWAGQEVTIAERATDGVQSFLNSLGVEIPELDEVSQTPDGTDVIELRSLSLDALDRDTFSFIGSEDTLTIQVEDQTVAKVHGMDQASTAVEWLEVVQGADSFAFDLTAIHERAQHVDTSAFDDEIFEIGSQSFASADILDLLDGASETLSLFGTSADTAGNDLAAAQQHGANAAGTLIPDTDYI
ncbi:MAG: hypothetical protein JJ979_23410, partial [Roseibium sp.]|nr:hypothetical protein [Roseibium sp.]